MIPPPRAFGSASSCWPGSMESKLAPANLGKTWWCTDWRMIGLHWYALICLPGDTWCLVLFSCLTIGWPKKLKTETIRTTSGFRNSTVPSMSESRCHRFLVRDSPAQKRPETSRKPNWQESCEEDSPESHVGLQEALGWPRNVELAEPSMVRCWKMLKYVEYNIYIYWSFPILFRVESMSTCPCTC